QDPCAWCQTLHKTLTTLDLTPSVADPCMYITEEVELILFVDVDYMGITGFNSSLVDTTCPLLQHQFNVEDLGQPEWVLGVWIL
ncbi:unnamed protein product, partial [Choristocarpus tenellus]